MASDDETLKSILDAEKGRAREAIHKALSETPFDDDPGSEQLLNDVFGYCLDLEAVELLEKGDEA